VAPASVAAKTRSAALIVALFAACHAASAAMMDAPDCGAPDSLQCRADSVLHLLYDISYVLGFVLIVIVVIAVRIYLRNRKRKNLLHD
jgi:hypothetical protein